MATCCLTAAEDAEPLRSCLATSELLKAKTQQHWQSKIPVVMCCTKLLIRVANNVDSPECSEQVAERRKRWDGLAFTQGIRCKTISAVPIPCVSKGMICSSGKQLTNVGKEHVNGLRRCVGKDIRQSPPFPCTLHFSINSFSKTVK